ncbi:hypothetical protein ACERZ8_20030 [Tateyamaria armeniaca]|uniref:Uncharacterized protein n=1 Tax=Tateyamaria armeniaca TaxID=2518930 RepID=A0ABW8UZ02_9RHOB
MPDKKAEPTFEELKKEMDAFFADFEKRLKALKLDPKVNDEVKKNFMPTQKQLMDWAKKNQTNNAVPMKKFQPLAKKSCKGVPWFHISASKGMPPEIPDGIKFNFGSKKISAGFKLKFDSKKQKLKLEPVGTIKFNF